MRLHVLQNILLLTVLVYSVFSFKCSFDSSCDCILNTSTNLISAKCSNRGLLTLPYFCNASHSLASFDGSYNKIERIPNYIFGNAKILTCLDLSHNSISFLFPESFQGLEELVTLNLESNNLKYDIDIIPSNCFKNTPQLRYLNLKTNVGYYSSAQKYPNLSSLSELEILKLDGLPHDSFPRGFKKLSKLTYLDLSSKDCDIEIIQSKFFQYTPHLRYIDISHCQVKKVWKNTFSGLKNLTHLNVSYNENLEFDGIGNITYDLQFTSIEVLKFNKIHETFAMNSEIRRHTLKYLQHTNLRELHMDSNRLQNVKTGVVSKLPKTLDRLSMADNMLSFGLYILEGKNMNISFLNVSFQFTSHKPTFGSTDRYESHLKAKRIKRAFGVNFPLPFPKNLREVHVRGSQLQFDIPRLELMENKLEYFDASLNLLSRWRGPTVDFLHLKFLNLSSNYCSKISSYFFEGTAKLEKLYIQNNLLGFSIPYDVKAIFHLESVAEDHRLFLNLSGNPFVCSCATLEFLKWISETKIDLLDRSKYECKYENGSKSSLANVNDVFNKLQKECSSYPGVIIGITGAIFLSVSIILFGLFYRYRWNLRYLYYITKNRFRGYIPVIENSSKSYIYDAFISYAEHDGNFVHHDAIDNLEKEGNLKLCVHRRDFLPGNEISANITSVIHNSRKTVIILTRHYLNSQWCMFEFNMARMESMYSRETENTLFLVFLTKMIPKELPLVMMEYIDSNSYIEYPCDEYGNVVFWRKMIEALRA
ncbi:unnamed protein product [Mytilus coruscus]|uniref:TIR domain-containing protein n=1 Tax=Mytilus coruscus TaxID=42192 RepID=A0A6J8CB98_MYTCO|nr:unnamed protein product [Mytilus coruscus]